MLADLPVVHVNSYEAEAYCNFRGRRLPTEAEWEYAATCTLSGADKTPYPWGEHAPGPLHANVESNDLIPVSALPSGDSSAGCRQLIGNVWEWTASAFRPYPGFVADPYKEYSQSCFETHRVLRGGSFATPGRLIRNSFRYFSPPQRSDDFVGFRTCALG